MNTGHNAALRPWCLIACFLATASAACAQNVTEVQVTTGAQVSTLSIEHEAPAPETDEDNNGLPDAWETANFGQTGIDPRADADSDGLSNAQEQQRGTIPNSADTDGDGVPDGQEVALGTDPTVANDVSVPTVTWLSRMTSTYLRGGEVLPAPGLPGFLPGSENNYRMLVVQQTITEELPEGYESGLNDLGTRTFTAEYNPSDPDNWNISGQWVRLDRFPDPGVFSRYPMSWAWHNHANGYRGATEDTHVHFSEVASYHPPYLESVTIYYTVTIDIRLSNPGEPEVIPPYWEKATDSWLAQMPSVGRFDTTSSSAEYRLLVPSGSSGTLRWFEVYIPASGEAKRYTLKEWQIDGILSPIFTLSTPDAGTASIEPFSITAELAVDANRDGEIKLASEDDSDGTSEDKPYRFWINDDIDKLHTFEDSAADSMATVSETEEDDIGPAEASQFGWQADYLDGRIESKRDLEDFSRLWINAQGLIDAFKSGDFKLGLKWTDTGSTTPAIKLYESVETDGGLGFLSDDTMAAEQLLLRRNVIAMINAATGYATAQISGSEAFVLPASLFSNLSENQPKLHLLFEGCTVGKGQLKFVIVKLGSGGTYTVIGEGPGVWMDLKKIGDMYEQWSVGNGSGSTPDAVAGRVASETGSGSAFSYSASSPEEQKYILFVHGWNMEKWEKERFAETAYKRLWWQGYKGRFGLFTWPTTNGFGGGGSGVWGTLKSINGVVNDGTNFDRGEFSAWRSGAPLRQLMQTLSSAYGGKLYVLSHSMGGIVASEALRLQSDANGGQVASVYIASQAALSAHAFDGTLSEEAGSANAVQWRYDHPRVTGTEQDFGPQTPNIYKNWTAFVLRGSASSSKAVGALVNFYNANDWALAAPAWQFNQITKPDWPDGTLQPWRYAYAGDPETFNDVFEKTEGDFGSNLTPLHLGARENPENRYEIMAFAAESRVKAFGATPNLSQGVSNLVDLRLLEGWSTDSGANKAHKWHSGQFRSSIQQQKSYWKTLLGEQGFNLTTTTLP